MLSRINTLKKHKFTFLSLAQITSRLISKFDKHFDGYLDNWLMFTSSYTAIKIQKMMDRHFIQKMFCLDRPSQGIDVQGSPPTKMG